MQFRISTLLWATLLVAASLAFAGLWGIGPALYWIVCLWWAAGPGTAGRPRRAFDDVIHLAGYALTFLVFFGCFLALPVRETMRERARLAACEHYLQQIALAVGSYRTAWQQFPPAVTPDAAGQPAHSWRVLVLPHLDQAQLYRQYDFNQPWNAAGNAKVAAMQEHGMQCPSDFTPGLGPRSTNYLAVVGRGTVWSAPAQPGAADTRIAITEIVDSGIDWAEPKDLDAEEFFAQFRGEDRVVSTFRSPHAQGVHVVLADGRVEWLPREIPRMWVEIMLYTGLSPKAKEALEKYQAWYPDHHRPVLSHGLWGLLAWLGSVVAFGVHAFRFRRSTKSGDQGQT